MLKMVCTTCRGINVMCDAYAIWNLQRQEWELSNTFDKGAYCDDCDGETTIDEEEVTS